MERRPRRRIATRPSWLASRGFRLIVAARATQRGLEIEIVAVAPVHEVAEQIAQAVLVITTGRALKLAKRRRRPFGAVAVHLLRVWRERSRGPNDRGGNRFG